MRAPLGPVNRPTLGSSQQPAYQQSGFSSTSSSSSSSNNQPGYLPDYQGDRYTNQQRIQETQALNKAFFDSIGGAPPSPAPPLAAQGANVWEQTAYRGGSGGSQGSSGMPSTMGYGQGSTGYNSQYNQGRRRRFARHLSQ